MLQSQNIASLAKGLIAAHKAIDSGVGKNALNETCGRNYADLGAVINAVKGALNDAGIVVIQSPTASTSDGYVHLTTRFVHETGEWMEDTCTAPMPQLDPQGFGTAISYLRRYTLAAMMGLYQRDDDGQSSATSGVQAAAAVAAAKQSKAPKSASSETGAAASTLKPAAAGQSAEEGNAENSDDVIPPVVAKRVASWLTTIGNANQDRLTNAREQAASTFHGKALEQVVAAIARRTAELKN